MSIRTPRNSARVSAAAIVVALIASLFAFASPAGALDSGDITRYPGADRYETAALAALDTFEGAGAQLNIVLASGENFPDGLAGAYLAGVVDGPILLTAKNALPASTANALGALGGANEDLVTIHILGGVNAIAQGVRTQLANLGYVLNEIGGATRYDTAQNVAALANTLGGVGLFQGQRTAIVATGENFPDALAGGAPSYAGSHPIILTTGNALSPQANTTLTNLNIQQVIVLGGTNAVSAGVVTAIEAKGIDVVRLGGANRFGTAALLANVLTDEVIDGGAGWDADNYVLAYGMNFPDALTAAQVGGQSEAPILLTGSIPTDTCNVLTVNGPTIDELFVMGGINAISAQTVTDAIACAEAEAPTATITALDGRTSFTVQFSAQVINSLDTDNYRLNNSGANIVSVTAGAAGSNTVTVTLSTTLEPNDLITVNPAGAGDPVQTGAGGIVPLTNFTVAADTTDPVVSLARYFDGVTLGWIFLSEPVYLDGGPSDITVDGVAVATVAPLGPTPTTGWYTTQVAPEGGDSVQIAANTFEDQATTPNGNPAYSTQVATDTTKPTLLSATYTTTALDDASINFGNVEIFTRATGIASGHLGNAWTFEAIDTAGPGVTVQVNTATKVIRLGAPDSHNVVVADMVIALANNATYNANFYTVVYGGPTVDPAHDTNFTGGTSTVRVLTQWSEQLRPVAFGSSLNGTALVPSPGAGTVNGGTDASAPFLGRWVISYVTPTAGAIATQIVPPANSILDLAGNTNLATAANITAG